MSTKLLINETIKPQVHFDPKVYDKIMHFVNKTPLECSGLGLVKIEENILRVVDAWMLPQKNSSGDTELDPAGIAKAMYVHRDCESRGEYMNFWWHSHQNMGVFWSATDKTAIETLGKNGWVLATVFNKKYEMKSAICFKKETRSIGATVTVTPFGEIAVEKPEKKEELITMDDLSNYIMRPGYDQATIDAWDEEFKVNELTKPEKVRSIYARDTWRNPSQNATQEVWGTYGEPGYVGVGGYHDETGTYHTYKDEKEKRRMRHEARVRDAKERKEAKRLAAQGAEKTSTVADGQQQVLAISGMDDFKPLKLPEHLFEYEGCWSMGMRAPDGHTHATYRAMLNRHRELLEIDSIQFHRLVLNGTPPMYCNYPITELNELCKYQEYVLEGGDFTWGNLIDEDYELMSQMGYPL